MEDPRPDKVAVVQEVQGRLDSAEAAILTEYRGLTVAELAQLRQALAAVGGDYKVYKNTLVRLAVTGSRHEGLTSLLTGPTAIAFVSGEISAVAKALRDFSRTYPALVLKGGQHGDGVLSTADLLSLADLPSRDVLLARVAGAIAAPMQQLAGLLQALPRNLAYGLQALIDQRGGPPAEASAADAAPAEGAETADAEAPAAEAAAPEPAATEGADPTEAATADAAAPEAPAEEPAAETETAPEG
jgi:large subunit ribosomal protein L10